MTDYALVLKKRHPNREWTLDNNDYESLTMTDGGTKPTKQELDDAWPDVQSEIAAEKLEKQNAAVSAHNKLKALGLTDDEITALVG